MRLFRSLLRRLRREDGNATIEFVILFPFFIGLFASSFEAAYVTMRQVMLERATDIVVRNVRLGIGGTPTHDSLKRDICNTAGIIPDCMQSLHIEFEKIDKSTFALRTGAVQCVDRDEEIVPATNFNQDNDDNDLMLMTVCAVFQPMVPTTGLGLKLPKVNGGSYYALVAITAFVNEPNG